ncbi:hypothetical protein [Parabacteroides sp. FAFU027]|uniref:hypothetical protein n=1 Tax=Parabacteroides sp. FAFU027 TaxID=2922715 RepID=UPI001FAE8D87|nr:hypothetical protein [Parabacteroides sp. FAFU027]
MKRVLLLPLLLLLLIGCSPVVTFDRPQPAGVDSLTKIPKKLIGKYISNDGSAELVIDPKSMIIRYDYEVKIPKDSVNWYDMSPEEKAASRIEKGWVIQHILDSDTLFQFSEGNVLKKFKGYYILNSLIRENAWFVQKMKLQKGMLTIGEISTEAELDALERVKESPIDTATYNISFTRKQFQSYMKSGFSKVDTFKRVK